MRRRTVPRLSFRAAPCPPSRRAVSGELAFVRVLVLCLLDAAEERLEQLRLALLRPAKRTLACVTAAVERWGHLSHEQLPRAPRRRRIGPIVSGEEERTEAAGAMQQVAEEL